MSLQTFFDEFTQLADAPNGVQKLRELILQLAVQGKLVTQDANDEPARDLIARIKKDKTRLEALGKIRKGENLEPIKKNEIPENLPSGWAYDRLGNLLCVIRGASPRPKGDPKYFSTQKTPYHWIKISDIKKYSESWTLKNTDEFLTEEGCKKSVYLEKGTFILSNSATIGVPCILGINGCIHDGYLAFPSLDENFIKPTYLYYFFQYFQLELKGRAFGGAQLNLNTGIVKDVVFPLPPYEEQKRIVAKIGELMHLCDELEAKQQAKRESRIRLNNAVLAPFNNVSSLAPGEVEQALQRLMENFDSLYDATETVGKLRSTILQLAVQGKLGTQNPNDEPVNLLIERIEEQRAKKLNGLKAKNKQLFQNINNNEKFCGVPNQWQWIRLNELGRFTGGATPSTNNSAYWDGDIFWVSPKDMKSDYIIESELKITVQALKETRLELIPKRSILIVARSGILKRLLPVAINEVGCTVNQDLKVIIPFVEETAEYIQLMLKGFEFFILKELVKGGMTVQSLKYSEFECQVFPLPPLAEQCRIVAKVNQLMALCDELETKLRQADEDSERLMNAAVKYLIDVVNERNYEEVESVIN